MAGIVLFLSAGAALAGGRWCGPGGPGPGGPGWGWWGGGPRFGVTVYTPPPQPVYYRPVYVERVPRYSTAAYAESLLVSAQVRLARLGYYRGAIDGDFGPQTSRALRNYQIDYGLPVTGRLDGRTLASLGV